MPHLYMVWSMDWLWRPIELVIVIVILYFATRAFFRWLMGKL